MARLVIGGYGGNPARLVVRGYGVRPMAAVPDISGSTFFDALRDYLKSYPTLGELTDVYYRRTKPDVEFPYLVFSPVGDRPQIDNSETYWEECEIQFAVVTTGQECDEDAERIGQAAYRALAPKWRNDAGLISSRPKLTSTFAYEITAIPGNKYRIEQPRHGRTNQPVFAFYFNYTFHVGRSMAENE